jgi:hypothetical protein
MPAMTSTKVGCISASADTSAKVGMAAFTLPAVHLQQRCLSFTSQAGLEHCSSHLGRGQVVGLAQDHEHDVSSQSGAQLAFGAMHVV